jgi:cell division septation protein DedD
MNSETKQRVVGIIVLVAFIALLIPFLFSGSAKKKISISDEMPISMERKQMLAKQISDIGNANSNNPDMGKTENSVIAEQHVSKQVATEQVQVVSEQNQNSVENGQSQTKQNNQVQTAENKSSNESQLSPEVLAEAAVASEQAEISNESVVLPPVAVVKDVPKKNKNKNIKNKILKTTKNPVDIKDAKGLWSVQVGSFSDQARIRTLTDQLYTNGFRVYMQEVTTDTGEKLTRILVGRGMSKKDAQKMASRLQANMKIKGNLVKN